MTFLYHRHDGISATPRDNSASVARLFRRILVALRLLHRSIVRAKLRRLHNELLFRRDYSEMLPLEEDATKFPQRPLILGDKWDF